jgi:hypothetical protein
VSTVVAVIGRLQGTGEVYVGQPGHPGQPPEGQGGPVRRSGRTDGSHFVSLRYKTEPASRHRPPEQFTHRSAHPAEPKPPSPAQAVTASQRLHAPSPSISTAAICVINFNGTRFIRAFPPTMPSPATAHNASTAPSPTENGSS